jgi:hypothetical protein
MCFALYRKKIQILWKNPEILNFRHGQLIWSTWTFDLKEKEQATFQAMFLESESWMLLNF